MIFAILGQVGRQNGAIKQRRLQLWEDVVPKGAFLGESDDSVDLEHPR